MNARAIASKLEKAGVKLIAAMQDVGEGPHARLIRSIFTSLDATSSEINAEQVKVVMSANAEAGFRNGSAPPLGYRTYVAERRGKKDKKKLEIDPAERPLVELIFRLYLEGDGTSDPLGIDAITKWLRERGYTHRAQDFHTGLIYAILTRETYVRAFVSEVVMSRERLIIRGPNRALELATAGDVPADDTVRTFRGNLAHPEGFEPPTKEVEAPCSIQLSYGCPALR